MRMLSHVPVLVVFVLSGVSEIMADQATTSKTALEKLNDDSITAAVEGKLAADNIQNMNVVAFAGVNVQTERGTVILNGMVQTSEQKVRAEQLARQVNGVNGVTNNLQVQTVKQR
jgi:hyperosmotically inducible protein